MWKFGRNRKSETGFSQDNRSSRTAIRPVRRKIRGEQLESRCLMAANPLHVGVVYIETDFIPTDGTATQDQGADSFPDRFILSFTGGEPDTELTEVNISTDRSGDGLTDGDLIFDTTSGGLGVGAAHPLRISKIQAADPRATVTGTVSDGGQLLRLTLTHIRAGDIVEFTVDVDQALLVKRSGGQIDIASTNNEMDEISSGQEFQNSILTVSFSAPHYEVATGRDIFINAYGDPGAQYGLNIPPDAGTNQGSPANRSAAAVASTIQVPKPISIEGTVFVDDNLNLTRDAGEIILPGVRISLLKKAENGTYADTGRSTTTDAGGRYKFGTELGLMPGTYRIVETQPTGFFSVGSIPGTVNGAIVGSSVSRDILSEITIPLGDLHAMNYDFAEARPASVSGFVYQDDSDDGIRDAGERGILGVQIRLEPITTLATQPVLTTLTGADGSYSFIDLSPGDYRIIEVTQPLPLTDGLDSAGTVAGVQVGAAVNPGDRIEGLRLQGNSRGIEYNFGELPLGSLSGYVYLPPPGEDCEGDHLGDWIPIPNVVIRLYTAGGTLVGETRTLADGSYKFSNLPKGEYRIQELTPAGLIDGTGHVGMIDGRVVGTVTVDGSLSQVRLPAGKDGTRYDFCEAAPAKIEGYVYHDASNDGTRGASEVGIQGATIRLYNSAGTVVGTTQTDANGRYQFVDLLPGTYRIEETTPAGFLDGLDRAGTVAGLVVGSALNPGDRINNVVLKQGQAGIEYNFGELVPARIEGRVHADVNNNCVLDPGEVTLSGVVIRLLDSTGNEIANTTTNASGIYSFGGLRPGSYTVVQEQPTGFFSGGQKAGSTGGDASVENRISGITIVSAAISVQNDFCENPPSQLSGQVHADRDGDCVRDADEPGLSNVRIELLDTSGQVVATTFTNSDGRYEFSNLRSGQYTVRETQPVGYLQGGQKAGSKGGNDSQQDLISEIQVGWGETLIEYNFCELEPASIAGNVFVDSDGDCIHEPELGERTLSNVTIRLHDATGRIIATTVTNDQGRYQFNNLRPGEYRISEVQPAGLFQGGQTVGSGGGVIAGDDLIAEIQIMAGRDLIDYNFCEIDPASLAGMVFVDADRDCVYEPTTGERPLADVVIELRDANGLLVATTTTDTMGQYRFNNLRPGTYSVSEIQPAGYFHGGQTVGSGGGVITADDVISQIQIGPGGTLVNYDFCELDPSSLQGVVYVDDDGDCVYEPELNERPLAGVTVHLLDASGSIVSTTTTDNNGVYLFNNLRPGTYGVTEIQPAGFFQGGQRVGSAGGRVAADDLIVEIPVGPGQNLINYDFCELGPSTLGGRVWSDNNTNRTFDPSEQPIAGVPIELRNASNVLVATTVTDASGRYRFEGLAPGEYSVHESQPAGYFQGGQVAGSNGGLATVTDVISAIRVPGGTNLVNYDFPEQPPGMISGYVFQDGSTLRMESAPDPADLRQFRDGIRTADDTPLPGVVIELRRANGERVQGSDALPGTYGNGPIRVMTDANGYYEFTGLRGAAYSVYQEQPEGFVDSLDTVGSLGGLAVNAADFANDPQLSFLVTTLSSDPETNPRFDAILLIDLQVGAVSLANNFSEIIFEAITPIPPPPIVPPPVFEDPIVVNDTFEKETLAFLASRPIPYKPYMIGSWGAGLTWHLSIINAGAPRGDGLNDDAVMRAASSKEAMLRWTDEVSNLGRWRVYDVNGKPVKDAKPVMIGVVDGIPMVGDFNGDGTDDIAVYVNGEWLIDLNGNGAWDQGDLWVQLGTDLDRPVVGDWDGDGKDDIGIFGPEWNRDAQVIPNEPGLPDPDNQLRRGRKNLPPTEDEATDGRRFMQKSMGGPLQADVIDHVFRYGTGADVPLAGDWNGDGIDTIAVFRNGQWLLDLDGDGRWTDRDEVVDFGEPGDIPLVADWNGDEIDELAVVRGDLWIIDTDGDRRITAADTVFRLERAEGEVPVAGDWNGDRDGEARAQAGYYQLPMKAPAAIDPAA